VRLPIFETQPGETVLYRTRPNRKWYAVGWKIAGGLLSVFLITLVGFALFAEPAAGLLARLLSVQTAALVVQLLCLGVVPLLVTAWVVEDVIRAYTGEFILTDRRLWVRGSPYAWSQNETALGDITAITCRRDAVFVRQKSTRKLQVHMFSGGKAFVKAYDKFLGEK
jgi:hypothetical protein